MKCPFVHTYEHSPTHTSKHTLTNSHSLSSTHTLTTHIRCAAQQKWPTSENVDRLLCCPSVNKFVVCAAPLPLSPPFCTSSLRLSLHWHIFYSACFVGASRNPSKIESSWSCRDKRTHVPPWQNVTLLKAFVSRQKKKKKEYCQRRKKTLLLIFQSAIFKCCCRGGC